MTNSTVSFVAGCVWFVLVVATWEVAFRRPHVLAAKERPGQGSSGEWTASDQERDHRNRLTVAVGMFFAGLVALAGSFAPKTLTSIAQGVAGASVISLFWLVLRGPKPEQRLHTRRSTS
jgi:hypothetical protein